MRRLFLWSEHNFLSVNASKSQCIVICRKKICTSTLPEIKLNGDVIPYVQSTSNLGIRMNSTLTWDDQATKVAQTVYATLRSLWFSNNILSTSIKLKLVRALLIPHFTYADVVMGEPNTKTFNILSKAFNAMVRFVYNLRRFDHISHVLRSITGVPLREFLQLSRCTFLFNIINTKEPRYLFEKLKFQQSPRLHRNLIMKSCNYNFSSSSFFFHDACFWNSLPPTIKNCTSRRIFKDMVLSHLNSAI